MFSKRYKKSGSKVVLVLILLGLIFVSGFAGCPDKNSSVQSPGPGKQAVNFDNLPDVNVFRYDNVGNFTIYDSACISVVNSGNPSDKVDITFLAEQYTDLNKFQKDVMKYIDYEGKEGGLLSVEPFKSNKGKFNFYFVNQTNDLECRAGCYGIDRLICCDDQKVKQIATQCPSDKILVLVDTTTFCGASKDYAAVCTIKDPRAGLVLTHEFGHIFGSFGDEYTYGKEGNYDSDVPNCDSSSKCNKWGEVNGTGCFPTCGYTNLFRSTDQGSLMNVYIPTFGPLDGGLLLEILSSYKGESATKQTLAAIPLDQSYVANMNTENGSISLDQIYVTNSTSEDVRTTANYLGRILSFDDQVLSNFKIAMPIQAMYDHSPEEASATPNEHGSVHIKVQNFTFNIPYFKNGKMLEVYDSSGKKVDSIQLAPFAQTCGDRVCQAQENYLECAQDCPLNKKDNLCLPYKDNICDPDCPVVGIFSDSDCKVPLLLKLSLIIVFVIAIIGVLILRRKRKISNFQNSLI